MSGTIQMIKNPNSGRNITVGGKIHNKLIRDGVLQGIIEKDEAILYEYGENDDVEYLKTTLNKKLPLRKKAVVGRKGSKYENKIVARTRTPNTQEVVKHTLDQVREHSDDFDDELEAMIMSQFITEKPTPSKPIKIGRAKANKKEMFKLREPVETETEYETQTEYETDSESDFDNTLYNSNVEQDDESDTE